MSRSASFLPILLVVTALVCASKAAYADPSAPAPVPSGYNMGSIIDGTFDASLAGWTPSSMGDGTGSPTWSSGLASAYLGVQAPTGNQFRQISISQTVTLPAGVTAIQASTCFSGINNGTVMSLVESDIGWDDSQTFTPSTDWSTTTLQIPAAMRGRTGTLSFVISAYGPATTLGAPCPVANLWVDNVGFVPEPATLALLALSGMAFLRRRTRK
jgi:hypothetical protein